MRSKSITALLSMAALSFLLVAGGCRHTRHNSASTHERNKSVENLAPSDADVKDTPATLSSADEEKADLPEREEIRRSFNLKPDSEVSVHGINGRVKVETVDSGVAELLIVRSAKTKDDLQFHKINIERDGDGISIRVENDRKSIFSALSAIPAGRQRVILKLPKQINFSASGVNGDVTTSEIRGQVGLRGVNGQIKVARSAGNTNVDGVNGGVDVTLAQITDKKIRVDGVNGNIDLRFEGAANADLNVRGVNGNIETNLPNVQNKENETKRGRMEARIGNGGAKIDISGVNGNVSLVKAERPGATTAKTAER